MGREIRRVPPHWQHPQVEKYNSFKHTYETGYKPLHDETCQQAWDEWQTAFSKWLNGDHDDIILKCGAADYPKDEPYLAFCSWHGKPPNPDYYRPTWKEGEATWWQAYETVSEGTPVTPPFATQDELIDYLVANGDFWDQRRRREGGSDMHCEPWPRENAERFVRETKWAPSLVVDATGVRSGVEALADGKQE